MSTSSPLPGVIALAVIFAGLLIGLSASLFREPACRLPRPRRDASPSCLVPFSPALV